MTWVVIGFQKALFHSSDPTADSSVPVHAPGSSAVALTIVSADRCSSLVYLAWRLYFSMSGDFAEEL